MAEKLLFTRAEAAAMLSISLRTLDNLQARKEISVRRIGRKVLIPATELERFARRDHVGRMVTPVEAACAND
ncbi:MAG: helix-turn-helix domain-containing protein [Terriglobia bacterium]|jgi:excisionase family DNA binding protein